MILSIAVDVLVVAWFLYRQRTVRRVRPRLQLRLAGILAVIGLIELLDYTGQRHVPGTVVGILALSFVVGAIGLGALRAATVRIWRVGGTVLRQGTWATIGLWLLALALHYGAEAWIDALHGPGGIISASLLLWLGITYGVQSAVVHHRAEGMLTSGEAIDARSDVVGGRWWAGTWTTSRGGWGPSGPGGTGGPGGQRRSLSHPGAIDAHAEPAPSPPAPSQAASPPAPSQPAGAGADPDPSPPSGSQPPRHGTPRHGGGLGSGT